MKIHVLKIALVIVRTIYYIYIYFFCFAIFRVPSVVGFGVVSKQKKIECSNQF